MRLSSLRHDLPASIVVVFVAVPLCLGIALASGAPLFSGLIAGIVGGIVVGILSGSPLGVSGPAAGLAVIVLGAIEQLQAFETFLLAVVIAGVLQLIAGMARAGTLGYFFPSSVIKGMLSGIGIIIILKQIPHAFGYDHDYEGELQFNQPDGETTFGGIAHIMDSVSANAVLVTVVSMAILISWEKVLAPRSKFFQIVQGPLVAVLFGIGYQMLTSGAESDWAFSQDHLVSVPVVASFAEFKDLLTSPDWGQIGNQDVWIVAITLAIVASLETLLSVAATDKLDPQKRVTPTNRELLAQGTGNVVSGMLGGLPVTQVIVRSSANVHSGGHTKVSAILHGIWLLLLVGLVPAYLNLIPLSVLAAVLFTVGWKLAKPSLFKQMWSLGQAQFLPFIVTIVGMVFTDLLTGIGIGMAFAILVILRRNYMNAHFLHIEEKDEPGHRHRVHIRLSEEVSFLNKGAIIRALDEVPDESVVTIDTSGCVVMDHDIQEVIADFRSHALAGNIEVRIVDEPEQNVSQRRSAGTVNPASAL